MSAPCILSCGSARNRGCLAGGRALPASDALAQETQAFISLKKGVSSLKSAFANDKLLEAAATNSFAAIKKKSATQFEQAMSSLTKLKPKLDAVELDYNALSQMYTQAKEREEKARSERAAKRQKTEAKSADE